MTVPRNRWLRVGIWLLLVGALFHLLIYDLLIYLPPNGKTVLRVDSGVPVVALTIDDGPDPVYTPEILDVLDENAVKATFFMTGDHIRAHPETARLVRDRGHEIGNHGKNHEVLAFKSRVEIEESIRSCDEAIRDVLGLPQPRFVRVANGKAFLNVAGIVRKQERLLVIADAVGNDWDVDFQNDPRKIVEQVMRDVKPGRIIALHDGCAEDGLDRKLPREDGVVAGRDGTIEALREILARLKHQDLRVVTVGELVGEYDPVVLTEKPLFWLALAAVVAVAALSFRRCWRVPT